MNDTPSDRRQVLRQRFLEQARAAFDLLFDASLAEGLVTFQPGRQMERRVGRLTGVPSAPSEIPE